MLVVSKKGIETRWQLLTGTLLWRTLGVAFKWGRSRRRRHYGVDGEGRGLGGERHFAELWRAGRISRCNRWSVKPWPSALRSPHQPLPHPTRTRRFFKKRRGDDRNSLNAARMTTVPVCWLVNFLPIGCAYEHTLLIRCAQIFVVLDEF